MSVSVVITTKNRTEDLAANLPKHCWEIGLAVDKKSEYD
jgi:hypothetical protein